MTCEVRNKEINSQCAELLVRPLYIQRCSSSNSQFSTTTCSDCSSFPKFKPQTFAWRIRILYLLQKQLPRK